MKRKTYLYATGPLHNHAPNHSEEVFVRIINTSTTTPVTLVLRVLQVIGTEQQTSWAQVTVEPFESELKGFRVGDAETYQVQIASTAQHALLNVWGVDDNRRMVEAHRVLHSELSWVK